MSKANHTENDSEQYSSALEFPCDFVIKVMGKTHSDFEANVLAIIKKHYPNLRADEFHNRPSKDNNYMSISVTVHAESKQQLDTLYQALSNEPTVLVAL